MALPPDPREMRLVAGNGMVVDRRGEGPAVLLVHGLGGPMTWEKLIPLLTASHEVIVPHLPGFGDSAAAARKMSSRDHAMYLNDVIMRSGLSEIILAGISYGGVVAARLAAIATAGIRKLVLLSPTGLRKYPGYLLPDTPAGDVSRIFLRWAMTNRWLANRFSLRSFHHSSSRPPDLLDRYLDQLSKPGHLVALMDALDDVTREGLVLPGLTSHLPQDTLIAWGKHDRVLPLRRVHRSGSEWADNHIVIFPECGHALPIENPEGICRLITGGVGSP